VLLQIPLEIVGEVHAAVADETVLITASSDTITVDIPSLRVGLLALRGVGRGKQRSETISRANVVLQLTALSVQFRMREELSRYWDLPLALGRSRVFWV
jgi:serine kinase of HPr protein (carbohydrate metabolism regulator)